MDSMPAKMTVKEFKTLLEDWPDDWDIEFNGHTFYRFKKRDERMVNMEFNEICQIDRLDE
jgi:hypothetical protein